MLSVAIVLNIIKNILDVTILALIVLALTHAATLRKRKFGNYNSIFFFLGGQ